MYNFVHIKNRKSYLNSFEPSDRPVLFMLRGLVRSYKGWLGTEEDLSERFDVICVDLPGVGLSKGEKYLYTINEMADEMIKVINHLKLEKFYIVAPSLGSMVTYEIVKKIDHERIKGLILFVPSHSGFGIRRLSPLGARTIAASSFVSKEVKLAMLKNMLIGKTTDGTDLFEHDPQLERRWKNQLIQDAQDLGTKGQLAQVIAATKYFSKEGIDYIKKHQIPLKVLISTSDKMIPIKHKRHIYEYMKHPKSELIEMKNAGHDFVVTHKDQVIDVITKFVEDNNYRANQLSEMMEEKSKKSKGLLFFAGTAIAGTLLFLLANKAKKAKNQE